MKYNPFAYIRSEKDILKLVNVIIANTKGDGEKSSEDFWVKAERLLYCALIGYIWYEAEPEEKNFLTLLELINASEAREDDEEFQSPVDLLFAKLEKEHPDHFAVKQYRKFKMAAGKTLKSILISCGARLAPFDIAELRDLMAEDELELDTLGPYMTLYMAFICIALAGSLSTRLSLRFFAFHLTGFLLVLLVVSMVRKYEQLQLMVALAVLGLSVAALYGCYQGMWAWTSCPPSRTWSSTLECRGGCTPSLTTPIILPNSW